MLRLYAKCISCGTMYELKSDFQPGDYLCPQCQPAQTTPESEAIPADVKTTKGGLVK